MAYQYPHLMLVVKSFNYEGKEEKGFGSVADLYSWYNYLYKKSVNKPEELKAKVEELVKGKNTPIDKSKAISTGCRITYATLLLKTVSPVLYLPQLRMYLNRNI